MGYYLKNKNISAICKHKSQSFAAAGEERRIYLFSNSLEPMGTFSGHKKFIECIYPICNKILVSGSYDNNIKIWDIENRAIISTLLGHRGSVLTLSHVDGKHLVSGSEDKSLIIWSKLPGSSTYSLKHVFIGHTSVITGIIDINKREIISGEFRGDLRIWDIVEGACTRQIPQIGGHGLYQMKQSYEGELLVRYLENVIVWGAANNWIHPLKQFTVCFGYSIELFSGRMLLRGGGKGELQFIDYAQTGGRLNPHIQGIHSEAIYDLQGIAKNIVVTVSYDGYLKVIHPISRKCYLKFNRGDRMRAIAYFY